MAATTGAKPCPVFWHAIPPAKSRKVRPSTSATRAPSARSTTSRGVETPRATTRDRSSVIRSEALCCVTDTPRSCVPAHARSTGRAGARIAQRLATVYNSRLSSAGIPLLGATGFGLLVQTMLTVRDIVSLPALGLDVVGGAAGLEREVTWIHVSELDDPT